MLTAYARNSEAQMHVFAPESEGADWAFCASGLLQDRWGTADVEYMRPKSGTSLEVADAAKADNSKWGSTICIEARAGQTFSPSKGSLDQVQQRSRALHLGIAQAAVSH